MQKEDSTNDQSASQKRWLIIFVIALFVLAAFWSVDPSVFYILAGFCAFSLFRVLQNRIAEKETQAEPTYQQAYYKKPSFWDELKFKFDRPSYQKRKTDPQFKVIRLVVGILVGMIFLSVIIPIIFNDDSEARATEAAQLGDAFYDNQQYDSAAYYYHMASELNPDNVELNLKRGNAFYSANKNDSALQQYTRAIEKDEFYYWAYYGRGLIYFNRKDYRTAIKEGKKSLEINDEYTDAMLLVGDSFYNSSQLDSAMGWYEDAYSRGYRSGSLSHIMAYIYDTKGNAQKAIPFYKEALSYDSTRTEIYSRLGELVSGEEGNGYRHKAAQYQR